LECIFTIRNRKVNVFSNDTPQKESLLRTPVSSSIDDVLMHNSKLLSSFFLKASMKAQARPGFMMGSQLPPREQLRDALTLKKHKRAVLNATIQFNSTYGQFSYTQPHW
jgi:hypothetical protein